MAKAKIINIQNGQDITSRSITVEFYDDQNSLIVTEIFEIEWSDKGIDAFRNELGFKASNLASPPTPMSPLTINEEI